MYTALYAYPFHLEAWLELDTLYIQCVLHHVYYDVHIIPSILYASYGSLAVFVIADRKLPVTIQFLSPNYVL